MKYKVINLRERPDFLNTAAQWFHEKWGVPLEAYMESMEVSLRGGGAVPRWYLALEGERIIGGLGVIENDFHDRPDLTPNVCAVYTEQDRRGQGVAGALLNYVCDDMMSKGINTLYLVTDHTAFYERYGWEFHCMVQGDGDAEKSRMYIHHAVKPGRYRHYKGNEYEVLHLARHSETEEPLVIYRALYGEGGIWARPASMWNEWIEKDGTRVRRFAYIGE